MWSSGPRGHRYPLTAAMVLLIGFLAGRTAFVQSNAVITEQITFLYYKDLQAADRFFSEVLGLSKAMDADWVKLYRVAEGASLGAVQDGRGFLKAAPDKPVMVSWVVADAKVWFERLRTLDVKIVKPFGSSDDPPIHNFIFEDPAGYTFEILEWRKRPPEAEVGFPSALQLRRVPGSKPSTRWIVGTVGS